MEPEGAPPGSETRQRSVTADAIEHDLAQLWRAISEPGELPPVRASVLNLIVYSDAVTARQALGVLATLPGRHSSRILALVPVGGERQRLSADVAAHCDRIGGDGRRVCYEQVTLRFGGDAVGLLPGLILPLLLPDLPTVLWLAGCGPGPDHALSWLLGIADRVVVDSAVYGNAETPLAAVRSFIATPDRTAAIGDLNWGRIAPWRRHIAQTFEPIDLRPYTQHVGGLTVSYRAEAGGEPGTQVWLLAGWIMDRLGWRPAPPSGTLRWELPRAVDAGPARLAFVADPSCEAAPGEIGAVELTARAGGEETIIRTVRTADRTCATTTITESGAPHRQSIGRLEIPDDAVLLAAELNRQGRDPSYERAIKLAAGLSQQR